MNLNCLIVDDEPLARNLLKEYVQKVSYLNLIGTCSDALEAADALRNNTVDLLFLDIQMPDLTGIALLKSLQRKPMVILTTAYSEYALESYDLDVVDYLLKPVTLERFLRAVDKAAERTVPEQGSQQKAVTEKASPYIFVKDGTKLVKVGLEDIRYIEGLKDYVTIHTKERKIISLQRLKALEEQLPADRFIRIHNSYIIAVHAIDVIHKNEVQIGGVMLPVSDTYKKGFREFIERSHLQ